MLMACARNIPQAHAALKEGRWDRSKYGGVELRRQDARHHRPGPHRVPRGRARPRAQDERRRLRPVRAGRALPRARARARRQARQGLQRSPTSSPCTCPRTPRRIGFIDDDAFAKMKDGVRIINVARGGIVDEEALARALERGQGRRRRRSTCGPVEPTTDDILLKYDQVVATPHLGASTKEAQLRAGTSGRGAGRCWRSRASSRPTPSTCPLTPGRRGRRTHAVPQRLRAARQAHRADRRRAGRQPSRSPTRA